MSELGGVYGAMIGAGVALALWSVLARPVRRRTLRRVPWRRVAPPLLAAGAVAAITHWPVGAALAGAGMWFLPSLVGPSPESSAAAKAEGIASWTEMVSDTLAASAGLAQAVIASAERAPLVIRPEVASLAARLSARASLEDALYAFAEELADPSGDLVVAALLLSARGQAGRLHEVLVALSSAVREEVAMRGRIAASRARVRSGVRVVAGFSVCFGLALLVLARSYLAPFGTPAGEVVLGIVGALYAGGLWLMVRMARPQSAPRLLGASR